MTELPRSPFPVLSVDADDELLFAPSEPRDVAAEPSEVVGESDAPIAGAVEEPALTDPAELALRDQVDAAFAAYQRERLLTDASKPVMLTLLGLAPERFHALYPLTLARPQ
ncbi:MAG: hypothetical protein JWP97_5398 [Labilithrix sp.]|nr:hypothetical protein [Labilithrix sp.]